MVFSWRIMGKKCGQSIFTAAFKNGNQLGQSGEFVVRVFIVMHDESIGRKTATGRVRGGFILHFLQRIRDALLFLFHIEGARIRGGAQNNSTPSGLGCCYPHLLVLVSDEQSALQESIFFLAVIL